MMMIKVLFIIIPGLISDIQNISRCHCKNKDRRNQVPLDLHKQLATFCQAVNEDL